MKTITLFKLTGDFADNKDLARKLRIEQIEPELDKGNNLIIDFENITSATQSFIHALISAVIRKYNVDILNKISFKNCNSKVQTIIEIVVEYVQDGIFADDIEEK